MSTVRWITTFAFPREMINNERIQATWITVDWFLSDSGWTLSFISAGVATDHGPNGREKKKDFLEIEPIPQGVTVWHTDSLIWCPSQSYLSLHYHSVNTQLCCPDVPRNQSWIVSQSSSDSCFRWSTTTQSLTLGISSVRYWSFVGLRGKLKHLRRLRFIASCPQGLTPNCRETYRLEKKIDQTYLESLSRQ